MRRRLYIEFYRFVLNLWPCIWSTGGRVVHISDDFHQLRVRLSLGLRTRNIVGTIFGGSMYASTDPFFMLMLMEILGKDYVVWDKGCTIRFKKPAKGTIFADFKIDPVEVGNLKATVDREGRTTVTWTIQYQDQHGTVYSEFDKVIYVATKASYKGRLADKSSVLRV